MRVTSVLLTGVLALVANAQSTTGGSVPTATDSSSSAQDSLQAAIVACIEACDPGDVDCTSRCIAVPNPNEEQVNETNECVAACDQGEGTEADIRAYGECVQGCIGQHFFTETAGTPQPTNTAGSGGNNNNNNGNGNDGDDSNDGNDGNDGDDSGTNPTETSGDQSSPTETGAPQDTPNAAGRMMSVAGSAAGLFGFLAAVMAL
ncbi:hypothetical protein MMYC01_207647 [Madurella mycetomatis]|uniref:Uncharacterized protein n=1 Tax=Madurella mycetomatis TaxID=100816 RepID=A0A175VVR9_9PEZI|nr:hypothetical protein MMYC01_207647 [Madurella mycetomatis]